MDLNEAMVTARNGGKVRDSVNMRDGWSMMFFADPGDLNMSRDPQERTGRFYYVNPQGEKAHLIKFTDLHRASSYWGTTP